jgi:hypothetical protein
MIPALLAGVLLTGCATEDGAWIYAEEVSCSSNPYSWFGGLSLYMDKGTVGDSSVSFNFGPPQDYISNVAGSYNTTSGDYSYTVTYGDYYLASDYVSGYGTVFHNGAVDILHTIETTDSLGDVDSVQVREERYACEGRTERYSTGAASQRLMVTDYQIISPTQVNYYSDDEVYGGTISGAWWSDYSTTFTEDYGDDWYSEGVKYKTGEAYEEFTQVGSSYKYIGSITTRANGTQIQDYEIRELDSPEVVATVHREIRYNGAGTASYEYSDGTTCDADYKADGTCSYECSDGSSGDDC